MKHLLRFPFSDVQVFITSLINCDFDFGFDFNFDSASFFFFCFFLFLRFFFGDLLPTPCTLRQIFSTMLRLFQQKCCVASRLQLRAASPLLWRYNSQILLQKHVSELKNTEELAPEVPQEVTTESDQDVPWYLRQNVTSDFLETKKIELPEIPENAPPHLLEFLNLLSVEYGMDNFDLFNISELPEDHEFRQNNQNVDFIIVCSGKSEKHVYKAANQLRTYLKHEHDIVPVLEGMVSSAKTPAMRRRLLRRARKGPPSTDNDYGRAANSWVMCNFEGVDIHMLTPARRTELNLESLWCKPEDAAKYAQPETDYLESDSIFSGIRRYHTLARPAPGFPTRRFHTVPALFSQTEVLQSYVNEVQSNPHMEDEKLMQMKSDFEHAFVNPTLDDYNVFYQMWKSMHLARPDLVTFEDVEEALLAKYASQATIPIDWRPVKMQDMVEYACLLLDTPLRENSKELVDTSLGKMSAFISVLFQFSSDQVSIAGDPRFIPLLWRLCYWEQGEAVPISLKTVDDIIHDFQDIVVSSPEPLIVIAGNSYRNVNFLVSRFYQEHKFIPSKGLQELTLFTYGNASKWTQFWEHWESSSVLTRWNSSDALERLVRLAVYLSCRGDRMQMHRFLSNHWDSSNSTAGSFILCLQDNNLAFNSEGEKRALRIAVESMVESLRMGDKVPYEEIRTYVQKNM